MLPIHSALANFQKIFNVTFLFSDCVVCPFVSTCYLFLNETIVSYRYGYSALNVFLISTITFCRALVNNSEIYYCLESSIS